MTVENVGIGIVGGVVHGIPCRDTGYLAYSYVGPSVREDVGFECFATD